ncbi:hypothetical protein ACFQU7_42960 [Pseudoroseomonas wenyumeiae]
MLFTGVLFYDGQGFLVSNTLGVKSIKELDGASVCVQPGTTTEKNLADFFRSSNMKLNPVVIESVEEIRNAMTGGRCDAFTVGTSTLAAFRAGLGPRAEDFVVLPELISKEPLGPVVRKGDDKFFDLVRWTQNAMHLAEEFGITSKNIDEHMGDPRPDVQRLLGVSGNFGADMGAPVGWAANIIRQVGNYAGSGTATWRPWACRAAATHSTPKVACNTRRRSAEARHDPIATRHLRAAAPPRVARLCTACRLAS